MYAAIWYMRIGQMTDPQCSFNGLSESVQMVDQQNVAEKINIPILDVSKALAFIGDLSMGQPSDHSLRTAWLATQLGADAGFGKSELGAVAHVSLLRWSGCTANAHGFSGLIGDDVGGREAMLARREDSPVGDLVARGLGASISRLAHIHCEVSSEIARMLTLDDTTERALRHIFEAYDATGWPNQVGGEDVSPVAFVVSLAGDLEVLSRVYGIDAALAYIENDAGKRYPNELVKRVLRHGRGWHDALEREILFESDVFVASEKNRQPTSPQLIADVVDLKLPWMTRYSHRVAEAAAACCARLGASAVERRRAYLAGLIHGIGRASVPNAFWNTQGKLSASAWEKIRLVPYWTMRAGQNIVDLREEAEIASFSYERLDGSGYFRGARKASMTLECQVLSASVAWIALLSPRPWRDAFEPDEAAATIMREAGQGRFDLDAVRTLVASAGTAPVRESTRIKPVLLSTRELEILREISQGSSNKEVARLLDISLSTVRTHVESTFRKLECSTRAAATLRASAMGIL
jgi:HD-GYP domain-containing protein (c-di-GMP phosphodiesterase class II)